MKPRPSASHRAIPWSTTPTDEEARAFLQSRVTSLFKLMFWSFLALVGFLAGLYEYYGEDVVAPAARKWVYLLCAAGIGSMGFIWRVLLVRRPLSMAALYRLDLVYSLGIGAAFGASAYLHWDLRPAGYLSVVYSSFTVFARALIIPSSRARTAVASSITFTPMTIAAAALAINYDQDVPGEVFFVGYMLLCIVAIVLSAYGSEVIYGLRRQVTAAQQLGQYTLDRKIGEGGMGAVYLAHHVMLRRQTAVKLVHPDRLGGGDHLERFEREVQHMSQLTHPNNTAVYDYGRSPDGVFYYAMEYLGRGIDLENLVRRHGVQPSGRVIEILAQACGALNEAHTNKIIHRDIKPANIILCERGGQPDVVKVLDYGLVKEITAETGASTQVILGTPSYVAPEAVTDPGSIGPAADLYALGAVGYYLLTGKRVFEGKTAVEICIQHVTKAPTPPSAHNPDALPALEAILLRCLEKQPSARFATAIELRDALRAAVAADWDRDKAKAWWAAFHAIEESVLAATEMPTRTITVNLGEDRTHLPAPGVKSA
jgi:serine/threonine-protein kinase